MAERLRKPGTLLVVAVVCLASAVGNGLYDDDFSNLATIVFSAVGSLFLTAADKAERARRLQGELRAADRPNLWGNMGGGSGC